MQWFVTIFFMATDKRGVSALYLSEQLGVSYPTAWAMLQRIRRAMVTLVPQFSTDRMVKEYTRNYYLPK